jgi:hypothetical protein
MLVRLCFFGFFCVCVCVRVCVRRGVLDLLDSTVTLDSADLVLAAGGCEAITSALETYGYNKQLLCHAGDIISMLGNNSNCQVRPAALMLV